MRIKLKKLDIKADSRGWFAEIIRLEDLGNKNKFGQIHISTAKPGQTKGKHYHARKTEWFCVLKGKGLLILIDKKTGEKKKINVTEDNMSLIKIPPLIWHAIENNGSDDLYLLAYISESFNPKDPDTYYEEL